jgi:hypothetical protein
MPITSASATGLSGATLVWGSSAAASPAGSRHYGRIFDSTVPATDSLILLESPQVVWCSPSFSTVVCDNINTVICYSDDCGLTVSSGGCTIKQPPHLVGYFHLIPYLILFMTNRHTDVQIGDGCCCASLSGRCWRGYRFFSGRHVSGDGLIDSVKHLYLRILCIRSLFIGHLICWLFIEQWKKKQLADGNKRERGNRKKLKRYIYKECWRLPETRLRMLCPKKQHAVTMSMLQSTTIGLEAVSRSITTYYRYARIVCKSMTPQTRSFNTTLLHPLFSRV